MSAEHSALIVCNCNAAQLGRVYGLQSCNSNIIDEIKRLEVGGREAVDAVDSLEE